MKVTYQSKNYKPEAVLKRYVRFDGLNYWFCEVGKNRRYDLRQGTVDASEIAPAIRDAAEAVRGHIPSYVEWPIEAEG